MKIARKILSIILTFALLLGTVSALVGSASAQEVTGESIYWYFDKSTGTLTISDTAEEGYREFTAGAQLSTTVYTIPWNSGKWYCEGLKHVNIVGAPRPASTKLWFANAKELDSITNLDKLDTSCVVSMESMFNSCSILETVDLSKFDTSNVKNFHGMFAYCKKIGTIDVSSFDTSSGEDFSAMFAWCEILETLDVSNFIINQPSVDFEGIFSYCKALKSLKLFKINNELQYSFYRLFSGDDVLETIYTPCANDWTSTNAEVDWCFNECQMLVGGEGSDFATYGNNNDLLRVDGGEENPGYLTLMHTVSEQAEVAPTCTGEGTKACFICSGCGKCFSDESATIEVAAPETIPATGHTSVKDTAVAPTCTKTGLTEGSHCSACNTVLVAQEVVPATGHNTENVDWTVVTPATCSEKGLQAKYCTVCGEVAESEAIAVIPHTWDEGEITTYPTCTETGEKTFTCTVCGATTTQEIDAIGHKYVSVVTAPTCTEGGYTTYTCEACGNSYTADEREALGHDYKAAVTNPTCTENGYTTYTCSRCRDSYVANETQVLGHTVVTDVAVEPTCTQTGLTAGSHCSACNTILVAQEVVPATGHTVVTDVAVEPTCTQTGLTEGSHCSACNTVLVAQEVVPATGHTVVTDEAVAATCTETGLTEGSHCSACNTVLVAQETVEALGHDYAAVVTAPTCTAEGYTTYTCSRCGKVIVEHNVGDALGHTAGDAVKENEVAPTCTADGSYEEVVYCSVCGAELSREAKTSAAKGHADSNNDGKCDGCNQKMTGGDHCKLCGRIHDRSTFFGFVVYVIHLVLFPILRFFRIVSNSLVG